MFVKFKYEIKLKVNKPRNNIKNVFPCKVNVGKQFRGMKLTCFLELPEVRIKATNKIPKRIC